MHSQSSQNSKLQCLYNISKKKLDKVDFLHAGKHQSFLQVDFNTWGIKVSCKVILSLLMACSSILNVFKVTSLQCLYNISKKKKTVRNGVHFFPYRLAPKFLQDSIFVFAIKENCHNCFCVLLWSKTIYFVGVQSSLKCYCGCSKK